MRRRLLILLLALGCGRGRGAVVANGGFEDGVSGWTADGGGAAVAGNAHSGAACAGGDADAKGWTLSQSGLGVEKGKSYRVDAWVRAKGSATVALWTEEKGPRDAQRVAVWEYVPDAWTPVSAYVTAAHQGKLTIRFATSATKAGEHASVWIDDVALSEATLPVATQVEPGKGFDDEPSMVRAADGSYYVAWVSWRDGSESLRVSRFALNASGALDESGSWEVPVGPTESVLRWHLETADVTSIEYDLEKSDGVHRLGQIVAADGIRARHGKDDGLLRADTPHLAHTARASPTGWIVGPHELSRDLVAYMQYVELVWATRAPTIDRAPVMVYRKDEPWVLYENVETPGYRVSYEIAHHVVVANVKHGRLLTPKNYAATSPLWDRAQSPAAAFDDKGRLWVVYRKPRLPTAGWDVYLTGWTGNAWVPPIPVSSQKGMNRAPSLVIDGNRAVICYQADDLPTGWGDIEKAATAKSGVYLTSVELPDVPAVPHELEPIVENPAPWPAAEISHRFGDDEPHDTRADVGGEKMRLLFGDLHSHSDTSVCERLENGSADDVYAMQRDFLHLDFACMTDHAEDFNPYLWNRNAKLARANDVPGKFTVFLGEEWASSFQRDKDKSAAHPYGYYGHRNIVMADLRFPRWWNPQNGQTPAELWSDLRAAKANFVVVPHQLADLGTNLPMDWSFVDETAQPVAEIFQIRGSYEAKGAPRVPKSVTPEESYFYQGALKRGVVVGAIASPDHGGGVGKACVWAKENSREAILDALRARRCYGTTGARIELDVRVAGHFMGEKTSDGAGSEPVTVDVHVDARGEIAKVSICRGGEWIHVDEHDGRDYRFVDEHPPAGPKWYYVRVERTDGELAWSSPVWLGAAR